MSAMYLFIIGSALVFVSWLLTGQIRKYAIREQILDIPNARSSHVNVTPRGGGLGFVMVFLLGLVGLLCSGLIEFKLFVMLMGGGVLIAAVGWQDDKHELGYGVKMVFHFLAAVWAVGWAGGYSIMNIGFMQLDLSLIGSIVAIFGTVWMINLYNFMDGVDGIAATEAVSVALIIGCLLFLQGDFSIAAVCFLLAAAVAGFLFWNWPPARIFMGDTGSGFLGFIFVALAMYAEMSRSVPLIIWIMLLGVFVVDATVTLQIRRSRGKKIYEPHRTHVYQLAVQAGYSHKQVTLSVLFINILLGVLAAVALLYPKYLLLIGIGAAVLLIVLYICLARRFNRVISSGRQELMMKEDQSLKTYEEAAASKDRHGDGSLV